MKRWGIFYDAPPGIHIDKVATLVLAAAKLDSRVAEFVFNGQILRIDSEDGSLDTIRHLYYE